jgi:hypothetical protein
MKKIMIVLILTVAFGIVAANSATYPTVNAKDYGLNPHPDQLFDGCECCHGPNLCNSHD